jgi:4-amino-4-deoxy-L-arabinose transferase-like glycosyltransferase
MGRLLILDGLLAFCTTLAILSAFEAIRTDRFLWRWWMLGAAAAGLGILTKGPVALILLLPPIWIYRWLNGTNCRIGVKPFLAFAATVWGINLPWYCAMSLRIPAFVRVFFWEHNVVRFFQGFDHLRPVWFYIPVLFAGLLPATFFAYGFIRFLLSGQREQYRLRTPAFGFYLLAGGWCLFFFSMSGSKLPTYILPAFPLLCLAFGVFVANRVPRLGAATVVAAFTGLMLLHYVAVPWYARVRSPMGEPEKVAKYCGDPNQPIVGFPRSCDSIAFYLGRNDLRAARSKNSSELIQMLQENPRTVVLFTHRHSLESIRYCLPNNLRIVETVTFQTEKDVGKWFDVLSTETPWGLCDLAVVERK